MKPEHILMGFLTYRVVHFFVWVIKEELRELNERREHPRLHRP